MNKNILFSLMLTSMSLASEYNPNAYLLLDDELSPYALKSYVDNHQWDYDTQVTNGPTKLSEFDNDLKYINVTNIDTEAINILSNTDSVVIGGDKLTDLLHNAGTWDYNDLSNKPWLNGDPDDSLVRNQKIFGDQGDGLIIGSNKVLSAGTVVEGLGGVAGCKAYRYTNPDGSTVTDSLTFEVEPIGWVVGDKVSITAKNNKYVDYSTIISIDGNTVTFDKLPFTTILSDTGYDHHLAFVLSKPEIGNINFGFGAHSEGVNTKAIGPMSHAEGRDTLAIGQYSHAEGRDNIAYYASHAEGRHNKALNNYIHVEGVWNEAYDQYSHVEGYDNTSYGECAHVEGSKNITVNNAPHVEGKYNAACGSYSHAEGYGTEPVLVGNIFNGETNIYTSTTDIGNNFNINDIIYIDGAPNTIARIINIDNNTIVVDNNLSSDQLIGIKFVKLSHVAYGFGSHSEGNINKAIGDYSHIEGADNLALGTYSHVEGYQNKGLYYCSHVEGYLNMASNNYVHIEGYNNLARGEFSHIEGTHNVTSNSYEHAQGRYNKSNINASTFGDSGNTIHSIGIGSSELNRTNAVEVMQNGDVYIKGFAGYDGTNPSESLGLADSALEGFYSDNRLTFTTTPSTIKIGEHALIGTNVNFSTGGKEVLAVGHNHEIYGKESFTVHDHNIIGVKGFFWKAIDTENHLIYLSPTQLVGVADSLPRSSIDSDMYVSTKPEADIPYFGPKSVSTNDWLFTPGPDLGLRSSNIPNGTIITVANTAHSKFWRCFKVTGVSDGSVIHYTENNVTIPADYQHTIWRKSSKLTYNDNEYLIYFPDIPGVPCNAGVYSTAASFGCTALGDGNIVMGYNSLASGKDNRAEGHYSVALGYGSMATNISSFVWGMSSAKSHGDGTFNLNPSGGVNGFYIGDQNLGTIIGNNSVQPYNETSNPTGYLTKDDFVNLLNEAMTTGIRVNNKIYRIVSQDYEGD